MNNQPHVMQPILISRADCTPENDPKRPHDTGFIIDNQGHPVERPDLTPELNTLEANPNLMWEHWDEFWRKVHGPRVVYKDGEEDNMVSGVCAYYQIHRLPAGPSSTFKPPYPALTDEKGELYSYIWDKIPAYKRPVFDGLVYWETPTLEDMIPVGFSDHAVNKINHEGQIFIRHLAMGLCAQYVIIPYTKTGLPPICTVKVYYRKDGTQKEFQKYLLHEHSAMIEQGMMAKKYIKRFAFNFNINQNENEPFYNANGANVDAISVTYFENMLDCENYYASDEYREIERIEAEFVDQEKSEWWTGIVYPVINPESETVTDKNAEIVINMDNLNLRSWI